MDFRVLGPIEVYRDGRRLEIRRRKRGLLGLLLLAAGNPGAGRPAGRAAPGR